MTRRTKILLYVLFGVFSLSFSVMLTFPYDVLGRMLETDLARAVPGAAITINRIGPSLPLGLYMGDITYQTPPTRDAENGQSIQIDAVRIKPAWLKLLTLKPGFTVRVDALSGEVTGQAWKAGPGYHVTVAAKDVRLDDGSVLEKLSGLQVMGTVTGKLDADFAPGSAKGSPIALTDGTFDLSIDGARIKGGKVMGYPLPAIDLGSPDLGIVIAKGEGKIDHFKTKSSDIDLSVTGSLSIRPVMLQSIVNGSVKARLSDEWLTHNGLIKSALSMAPAKIRRPDGTLEVPLRGQLQMPVDMRSLGLPF